MPDYKLPDPANLRQRLRYQAETGKLFWREHAGSPKSWNSRYAGKEAFATQHKDGYLRGKINRVSILAHRAVWALAYGVWPEDEIDHIDGDPSNNRLNNLRQATRATNNRNKAKHRNNTSGVVGVNWCNREHKWRVQVAGRHVGYFNEISAAEAARRRAQEQHPFHPNHGRQPVQKSVARATN